MSVEFDDPLDERRRLHKMAKADALVDMELSYRQWGILYIHHPEILPDVSAEERE